MEIDETKKTKEEILKKAKNSIMIEEIVNEDIEKQKRVLKTQMKQQKQLIIWKKLLKVTNVTYYGLHTNKAKYLENSEWMKISSIWLKNLGLVNLQYYWQYQLVNKFPRMKKSSLSLHFLKNNFKKLNKFFMKMLVNLNRYSIFLTNIFILKLFKKWRESKECFLYIFFGLLKTTRRDFSQKCKN